MRRLGINKKKSISCKVFRRNDNIDYSDPYTNNNPNNKRKLIGEIEIIIKDNFSYKSERYGDHVGGKCTAYTDKGKDVIEYDSLESNGKSYKVIGDPREGLYYLVINLERIK